MPPFVEEPDASMLQAPSRAALESADSVCPDTDAAGGCKQPPPKAAAAYAAAGDALTTAASSAREVMPSFGKIRYRWLLMVRCDR